MEQKVKEVGVRVVAVDLKDFRNEATTGSSLDVDDNIERIGDMFVLIERYGNSSPLCKTQLVTRASPFFAESSVGMVLSVPAWPVSEAGAGRTPHFL